MTQTYRTLLLYLCLALAAFSAGASGAASPQSAAGPQGPTGTPLPDWQVLEFEEQAFWATANSRLEVMPLEDGQDWKFTVSSSVVGNSEKLQLRIDPRSGQVLERERVSRGKEQRLKSFIYEPDYILRERRSPDAKSKAPPTEWPVTSLGKIPYPEAAGELVVTSPHTLILLAQQLQAKGTGESMEVLVHTDFNFYRVRLNSGNGIPIEANYSISKTSTSGASKYSGRRATVAVALQVSPEGVLAEKDDFSLLGLEGDIILFFDKASGLPLQVRGIAPRIGATEINLKSVSMRKP